MNTNPITPVAPGSEQPTAAISDDTQQPNQDLTKENRPIPRRGILAAALTLASAALAWIVGRANAGHNTNIVYDSQTTMHLDVVNTTSSSTRISTNISGTAPFVVLNNYPVGISRPDGILGRTTYTTSNCAGVAGASEADSEGIGVLGTSNAANGTGVYGYAGSSVPFQQPFEGAGVSGSGPTYGIAGNSAASVGALGYSVTGDGVQGVTSGNLRFPVVGLGSEQAYGICGFSVNQAGVVGLNQSGNNYAGYFSSGGPTSPGVFIDGFFIATGTKSQAVQTAKHGMRRLYAVEATQPMFEDIGSARLENGQARVLLDPIFAATVNTGAQYHVFLTPRSVDTQGLAVVAQDAEGFIVREAQGGRGNYEFDYRIMAKVRGYEHTRLELFTMPTAPEPPKAPVLRPNAEVASAAPSSVATARVGARTRKDR
jgi:hypothetical protein